MSNTPAVQAIVEVVEKRAAEYSKAYEQVKALRKEMRQAVIMAEKVALLVGEEPPTYSKTVTEALATRRRNKDNESEDDAE